MSIGSTIRAGAAYVEVTAETSKLQRNLTSAQAQLQAFGRTCTTVGKDLLMLSGAMAVPLVMAAKSFAGFDDSMRLVQAVTQATDNDFKALTITSQRLGRETSYTAQQVADAMVALGRMGFSPKEIQAAIADVLNLARATGTDLSEAGDIAANSLRIFGLEAEKMGDISDVLTVTANSSAQTLTDLFEALKMGGPQAAAAGESVRETCAALAVLANMGIKGSLAGTALRKSFSQFAKVKVQEQLRAVGVETLDANGNLRKMAEIMRDIAKVMQTMPTAEKLAFAEDIFDIRGSLAGLTLTANTDELDAMLAKLMDVEGVAADTAQKMDAGLGGSFRLLMSAVEGAMNAIAAAMNSTLQPFIKKVTDVINVFTQWIEQHQGLVTAFAVVVAGAATLGIALVAIGVIAKGVSAGLAVLQTVTKGFAFVQGMCIAQATAMKSSILLIGQAFANYRNLAIPAMVGTEQFCAALGVASSAANRARASIILMSNAEAAAAAKSFLAAKWQAMTSALSAFRNSAIAATIATKAQAVAEMALSAKTAVINGWLAMTSALKGMTLASIGAKIALKAQAAVEMAMGAKTAILNGWLAMTTALKGMTLASISATVALKAQSVVEMAMGARTALLNGWLAMTNALKGLTLASIGSAIALKAQSAAELAMSANTAIINGWVAMTTALRGLTLASISATVALKAQAIAERAMTAGRAIAAAWTAMTTAVAGLTVATIGATIATKAQAAAEAICTASTSALNTVRAAGIAIVTAFTAANIKATIAVGAVAAGNFLLAAAAKVAAVAMMALSAVMSFVAAHPVAFALIALTAVLAGVCIALYRAASYTAKLSDEATKLREKGDQLRRTDEARMERLQQLAQKQRLTNAEMAEARVLAGKLQKKYGDLGITIKDSGIEISDLNAAIKRLGSVEIKIKAEDMPQFERLKELSLKAKLTVEEQGEADKIIQRLERQYGSLGVTVDKITGKITRLNTVAANLQDIRMKVSGQEDIDKAKRLQELAALPKLNTEQMKEANELISQLGGKYGELGLTVDATNGRIESLTEAQRKFAEATEMIKAGNDPLKETHLAQLKRLQQLTEQEQLTTEEQREAESIVSALNDAYAGLGLGLDKVTGKLKLATDAQHKFNDAMKEAALAELDAEISEMQANIDELYRENKALDSYWNHNLMSWITGRQEEAVNKTQTNNDRIFAYRQRITALRKRKQAIQENDKDAVTGSDGQTTEDKIQQERQRQQQAAAAVAQAERRAADIEKRWKREGQTDLENQIEDIIALRDEYKKLIQTMLDYEKAKPEDKQDKTRIAELERKLVDADREAERRIAQAKEKTNGSVSEAERQAADIERRLRRERQTDLENEIEDIIELRDEYKKLIQTMLNHEKSKPADKQDKKRIAELERKLLEADREAERRIAQAKENTNGNVSEAERQVAEIERRLRRERQTELQNEIEDIIALRDEYKQLIKTMLDFERAKDRDKQDQKRIAELERKLAEADKTAQDRIAAARAEAAKRLQEDVAGYQRRFDDSEKGIRKRRAEERQDRSIDNLLENNKGAGIARLQQLIAQYRKAAQAAKAQFQRELQAAQADGKIDNAERRRLDDAQNAFAEAESMVDKYTGRLRQAQSGTQQAARKSDYTRSMGSWSADELNDMLGGSNSEAARTASATEQMVRQGRETNRLLRRMDSGNGGTLTYK